MPSAIFAEQEQQIVEEDSIEDGPQKTKTEPRSLEPQRLKLQNDVLHSRIIVVCPYSQFNAYFESKIPEIIEGGYVDIVNQAEMKKPPYIQVVKKEAGSKRPLWIIDFGRIIAEKPSEVHLKKERVGVITKILSDYTDPKKAEQLFLEYLGNRELSPELKANNILKSLISDLRPRLMSGLEKELEEVYESVLNNHPIDSVVPFNLYEIWNRRVSAVYITPSPEFSKELESKERYNANGDFNPASISVRDYADRLERDLRTLAKKSLQDLELLKIA
jgi:hypothetical protein